MTSKYSLGSHESSSRTPPIFIFFFFNDTATTEIYTLSLHDALPISFLGNNRGRSSNNQHSRNGACVAGSRSEEHTSELQSRLHLVCRLLLEKKKNSSTGQNVHHRTMNWALYSNGEAPIASYSTTHPN